MSTRRGCAMGFSAQRAITTAEKHAQKACRAYKENRGN
jgi:3-oxoacyl-(acyl-carrier-protein) synthase